MRVTSASLDRRWLPTTLKLYLGAETIFKALPESSRIILMILCSQEQKIIRLIIIKNASIASPPQHPALAALRAVRVLALQHLL